MIFHRRPPTSPYLLIIRSSLGSILFLAPLIYLTAFSEPWELPKAWLLALGVTVALVAWLIWSFRTGRFQANVDRFDRILGLVVLAGGLGTLWSFQPYASLWGLSGLQSESFVVLLFGTAMTFLLKQTTDAATLRWYATLFVSSGILAGLGVLATIGGVQVFPGRDLSMSFLPTGPSSEMFSLYIGVVWLTAWFLHRWTKQLVLRRLLEGGFVILLLVVALLDRTKGLLLLLGGSGVLLLLTWDRRVEWKKSFWLWLAGGIALLMLVVPLHSRFSIPVNTDVTLPGSMGASIAWKTLEKVPVLGSGPGTFFYDFVRYRPSSFESLSIGQLRFVRPDSGFWQLLATYGIAGSLLLGSLVFFAFRNVFPGSSSRSKRRSTLEWPNLPGWMLLWVSLSLLLTSGSMLFTILFWAVLGLSMSAPEAYADGRSVKPKFGLMQGISIAACLVLLGGWYGIVRVWSAPLVAAAAGRAIAATKPLESIGKTIQRAIDLDPWNAGYHMQLAEQKMADLQLRAQSGQSAPTDTIVSDIERAEVFDYQNPAILERSIQLFGELARVRAGAAEMLLARYERLVQVEPSSARNRVEWGKAELLLSQTSKPDETIEVNQELAQSALRHFGQALDLKPGDVDARYHQALAHEVLGDRVAAKAIMRELAVQYPNESDLLYELARQERLDENTDEALRLLNRALEIVPGSIPVRLELARTYEARDEKDKALEILKVIDAARPNTTLITDWIKRLEAEAPAS